MKTKYILPIISIVAFSIGVSAEVITAKGGTSARTLISSNSSPENTLLLDSSEGARYNGNSNATFGAISVVNGENNGDVNTIALGSLTVDINASTGTVNALTANIWSMLAFNLNFKNSVSDSTAVANIYFGGNLKLASESVEYTQYQNLNFNKVNALVTVGGVTTVSNTFAGKTGPNTSRINVNDGANVTWDGNITFAKYGELNVSGKFTTASQLTFDANAYMSIAQAGEVTLSTFTTLNRFSSFGKFTQMTVDGVGFNGVGTIENGSVWNVKGKLHTYAGADVTIANGANVTLSHIYVGNNPRLVLQGGKLTINQALNSTTGHIDIATIGVATLAVGTDASFDYINQLSNDLTTIQLNDGGTLRLVGEDSLKLQKGINIYNFAENKVFVGTKVTGEELNLIYLFADEGQTLLGKTGVTDLGWLTVVPEPAEWAVIFGAIALGFAVYRRRK